VRFAICLPLVCSFVWRKGRVLFFFFFFQLSSLSPSYEVSGFATLNIRRE